ncbi:MAG: hypothetical protein M1826_000121 [Phylliscum demangeonii]|nr:MAG: hypothetical protein M1826_000121 [Phylliscum demangeonii]
MKSIFKVWENTIIEYNRRLFDVSDASIHRITAIIGDGAMIEGGARTKAASAGSSPNNSVIPAAIARAIYRYLIPQTWRLNNRNEYPFNGGQMAEAPQASTVITTTTLQQRPLFSADRQELRRNTNKEPSDGEDSICLGLDVAS